MSIKDKLSINHRMSLIWGGIAGSIITALIMKEQNFFPLIIALFMIAVTLFFGERAKANRRQQKPRY